MLMPPGKFFTMFHFLVSDFNCPKGLVDSKSSLTTTKGVPVFPWLDPHPIA